MSVILDPQSENYKRTIMYEYFNTGHSAESTVETMAYDFPAITTQEVGAWFARFQAGNMEIGENISINAEGTVVDRSVRPKRGLEDAEQAHGEPPARINPREVDEEEGTRQHPNGDGIRLVNQAMARQQATPHDVPMVAVHEDPTNQGIPQIEDPPVQSRTQD
ncbi:hypothetical protein B9Z55_023220 [Caenorhabditis nigoni]|uniref:Uncharacterized protein n=1 Tax=Caenorhabditis nigoni TaxID=1611254 RepID=A0A2G5SP01_9PELO|nr:hypothetical protein B9Z55_023220 [Caenorhabditis nigoni]